MMDDKEKIMKKNEEEKIDRQIEEDQEQLNEEDINSDSEIDKKSNIIIGNLEQAPKFLQENEYIKKGYVIGCVSFENALRCLFKFHNETMNTWTHLIGAIFFLFLLFYTIFIVTNFTIQLNIIKEYILPSVKQKVDLLYKLSQFAMRHFYESVQNIQENFNNYNQKKIYNETINNIFSLYNEVNNYILDNISPLLEYLKSFLDSLLSLKKESINLLNLDEFRNNELESYLDYDIRILIKKSSKKELTRFPLFIIIICAFLCLLFSTTYHALKIISEKIHHISHRFDHGGISLLITGSCFPPYFYFLYYETKFKYFYLLIISIVGLGIFLYSIISSDFSKPHKRTFRGILFLIFGICTGIPVIHMTFFGNTINGYYPGIKLKHWYLGGISYIIGAIIYILRFPEKKFQGKFDYIGSSHQIFHIFVFLGATFHYFGSLDAYEYRFKYL